MSIILERRMKRKLKQINHGHFIEYFFMCGLLIGILLLLFLNISFKNFFNKTIPPNQTIEKIIGTEDYNLYYNQFWQKLNTVSALSADFNHDSAVSSVEMKIYRQKFFDDNKLKPDENDQYVYDETGNIVSPTLLLCLLDNADRKTKKNKC